MSMNAPSAPDVYTDFAATPEPESGVDKELTLDELWDEYLRTRKMLYERSGWRRLAEDMGLGE